MGLQVSDVDDQWWAAEEAKWKAELDARREGDEVQAATRPATSPRQEAGGSGSLEEDICLRTQLILKLPEDQGTATSASFAPFLALLRLTRHILCPT